MPARGLEATPLRFGIVAAVVLHRLTVALHDRHGVGHLLRRDQIAAPLFITRDATVRGDAIEESLHHERSLRTPCSARRCHRDEIGEAPQDLELKRRQHVRADEVRAGVVWRGHAVGRRRSVIVMEPAADAEQLAVIGEGDFHVPELIALHRGGDEILQPIFDPLDRSTEHERRGGQREFLGMKHRLRPERAADIGRDHANAMLGQTQRRHQQRTRAVRHLRGRPYREHVVVRIGPRDQRPRLDRMAAALVHAKTLAQSMRCARECCVSVAVLHHRVRDQIVGAVQARFGCIGGNADLRIDHRGQDLQLRIDVLRGVFGEMATIGDDDCDRLAQIGDLVVREADRIDVEADHPRGCRGGDPVLREHRPQIRIGQHRMHPRHRARGTGNDATDARVRDLAAHEHGVQHVGDCDVVDEPALATQQAGIFDARQALADEGGERWIHQASFVGQLRRDRLMRRYCSDWRSATRPITRDLIPARSPPSSTPPRSPPARPSPARGCAAACCAPW